MTSGTSSVSDTLRQGFPAHFHVGFLAIMIWDALHNIRDDYQLLFSHEVKVNTVVYFISRMTTLIYALGKTIFLTLPLYDCSSLESALSGIYVIVITSTLLLALLRIRSIFRTNALIFILLGISLAMVIGVSMTFVAGVDGGQDLLVSHCSDYIEGQYVGAGLVLIFVHHAFLLAATTIFVWKNDMAKDGGIAHWLEHLRRLSHGSAPSPSSRYLRQDQYCFLMTMVVSTINMIWFFASSSDDASLRITMVVAYCVISNIMICRVYRNTTLRPAPDEIATAVSSKFSMSGMSSPHHFAVGRHDNFHDVRYVAPSPDGSSSSGFNSELQLKANALEIEVSKVVEHKHDTLVGAEQASADQDSVFHVKMV
ncbi:hypothetical protein GALMADRAFT_142296 [Galerina marginata CBS 339.88]|uniref:Transmembrane protein n=1 Tax=Galerina marginata (strain CBS 339.88) TaxID=685588 RepID=A0A067T2A1_GALM3|nr:hypothetical protein GALMADRAFT_142296 [Galerina marginata CBS 339.88]